MATDWSAVLTDAINAAKAVLAGKWPLVQKLATTQVTALVENAKTIEDNKSSMTADEYETTKRIQQNALAGVLTGVEAIGIVTAEQVADAVWNVIVSALKAVPELAFLGL